MSSGSTETDFELLGSNLDLKFDEFRSDSKETNDGFGKRGSGWFYGVKMRVIG